MRSLDSLALARSALCQTNAPASRGVRVCTGANGSGTGAQRQVVRRQDRQQRLVEAAGAVVRLLALAAAAAARQDALGLAGPGNERAARVAAFGTGGGARQVEDRFAAAVVDGLVLGLDRAAAPARGPTGAADRGADGGFGATPDRDVALAPTVDRRQQRVARVDPDPGVVAAGLARLREFGRGERADPRPDRPLR